MVIAIQLKIELVDSEPKIWRRFLVTNFMSFHKLHEIIQAVMGWENSHLYEFSVGGTIFQMPDGEDKEPGWKDSRKIKLHDMLKKEGQKFTYTYDFGDGWEHSIVVEKIVEGGKAKTPVCIDGRMSCPPEDCGGIGGYFDILEIRKNKKHPDYNEIIVDWLGEDFDPEKFSTEETNKRLAKSR